MNFFDNLNRRARKRAKGTYYYGVAKINIPEQYLCFKCGVIMSAPAGIPSVDLDHAIFTFNGKRTALQQCPNCSRFKWQGVNQNE